MYFSSICPRKLKKKLQIRLKFIVINSLLQTQMRDPRTDTNRRQLRPCTGDLLRVILLVSFQKILLTDVIMVFILLTPVCFSVVPKRY